MESLKLKPAPKGKGLVLKIAADLNYAGFYCDFSKHRFEVCLGFIAIRLYFMSEARLSYISALAELSNIIESHEVTIVKGEE